jgi:N-acetyl sugar amidotransferase
MGQSTICTRCVMDSTVPDIKFNSKGVCNYCTSALARLNLETSSGDTLEDINSLVHNIKKNGKNKKYDCVIGVSGGVDSSYVAYLVKKVYGLRPLAVHFDNGWNSNLAVENIENLLNNLGIDFKTHVVDWKEFRDLQLSFIKSSIANCEIPTDQAIIALLYKTAHKYNIKYIIHGGNISTESIMPDSWMESSLDLRFLNSIHSKFGSIKLKTYPKLGYSNLFFYTYFKKIRYLGILNYLKYNKEDAMKFMESEFNWKRYEDKHFESIFTRWFQGYLLPKKFNIDKRIPHFSSLIISDQMTRKSALSELKNEVYSPSKMIKDTDYIRLKFNLSKKAFNAILTTKIKSINDYPNSLWILKKLDFFVKISKNIASERKG